MQSNVAVENYETSNSRYTFLNVALAIIASTVLAIMGYPDVSLPICGMVGAVYGVSSTLKMLQKRADK